MAERGLSSECLLERFYEEERVIRAIPCKFELLEVNLALLGYEAVIGGHSEVIGWDNRNIRCDTRIVERHPKSQQYGVLRALVGDRDGTSDREGLDTCRSA